MGWSTLTWPLFFRRSPASRGTSERVAKTGERITNLQRVFSMKCGITGADDKLPAAAPGRAPDGSHAGRSRRTSPICSQDYYRERGWDEDGPADPGEAGRTGLTEIVGDF